MEDRNGMDLIEAEDTKKRWQWYTKELYKKDLNDLDNHDWIPAELFQILKDDVNVKGCTQYASKFGKISRGTGLEKG